MFQFKYAPLYLEWAPVDIFQAPAPAPMVQDDSTEAADKEQVYVLPVLLLS